MKAIWTLLWLPLPAMLSAQATGPGTEIPVLATNGAFFALIQIFGK